MTAVLTTLLATFVASIWLNLWLVSRLDRRAFEAKREYYEAQIRWMAQTSEMHKEFIALTEAYIRSKGDTVLLRPPAATHAPESWQRNKPAESFIKEVARESK